MCSRIHAWAVISMIFGSVGCISLTDAGADGGGGDKTDKRAAAVNDGGATAEPSQLERDAASAGATDSGFADDLDGPDAGTSLENEQDAGSAADPCADVTCQNGGSCAAVSDGFSCICAAGYAGTLCEIDVDECLSNACENGASCVDGIAEYTCACAKGFTGTSCEINIDDCPGNQCLNGATCIDGVQGYSCKCATGFDGTLCDHNIDDCANHPCQHGTCGDGIADYTCSCDAGYEGKNCDADINECAGNACQHGASCVDGVASYTCACAKGYTGTFCETNPDDCLGNQCQNGSSCVDGLDTYSCACLLGYGGTHCETNLDDCSPNPCQNGGSCSDGVAAYTCACLSGFSGSSCENNIDDCPGNQCQNGATCKDGVNAYTCQCATGFDGTFCGNNINDCASAPCEHGSCSDGIASYTCACDAGYTGTLCDQLIDTCDPSPCQNDGVCIDAGDGISFRCACPNGFTGDTCETITAATTCSGLWSSVSTFFGGTVSLGGCDAYPAAREIVGALMSLEGQTVTVGGKSYVPCVDFRCDSSYVYVVSTNLPFYDPPSWLPGSQSNPPTTNLIFRLPLAPTAIRTPQLGQYIDANSLGASCDDAYQYFVGITSTDVAQEPYGFCAMGGGTSKYFKDGSTYYRRTNCLIGNGVMINGEQIYGSNEAKNGSWGNPAFYYPDVGTSSEQYYKSSSGTQRPGLDVCGTHFHHHGINAACYERDDMAAPIHTAYTNADVKGLFDFEQWIYASGCSDESEIVGYMPDGVPIKGPCVCMARDATTGTCTDARHVRSSYMYTGLNAWKGSSSSTSTAANDLANYEGKTCSADSDCGSSGSLECTWSVFADGASAVGTAVDKRCVAVSYGWCNHLYQDRAGLDTQAAGIQYLDRCNGVQSADGYAYRVTGSFPYVPSCLRYEPSDSITDSTL